MSGLANVYDGQGLYSQALDLHQEALKWKRRRLGKEDPSVLVSMANVAGVLRSLGDFQQAGELYEETLEISRRALGSEHRHTAAIIGQLGGCIRISETSPRPSRCSSNPFKHG